MHEEVARLPERYRRAVVLCHFEGLTQAEAARRLGCAPGTVGSLVTRARDMLRTRLTRRGVSVGAIVVAGSLEPRIARAAVPMALERATIQAALLLRDEAGGGRRHRLGGGGGASQRSDQDHDAEQAGGRGHAGPVLGIVGTAGGGRADRRCCEPMIPGRPGSSRRPEIRAASIPTPRFPGAVDAAAAVAGPKCAVRRRRFLRRPAARGERRAAIPGCPLRVRLGDGPLLPRRPRSREPQACRRRAIGTIRGPLSGHEEGSQVGHERCHRRHPRSI